MELLVGVIADPDYGQVLVIGAGGVQVELMKDTVQLLLPASRQQIEAALLGLRIGRLITGFRGSKPADLDAAVDAIEAITQYARTNVHRLLELDVNPLLVRPVDRSGCSFASNENAGDASDAGAVVVDALIRMSQ